MLTALSVIWAVLDFTAPGFAWILITGIGKRLSLFGQAAFSFLFSICFLSFLTAGFSVLTADYLLYAGLLPLTSLVIIVVHILRAGLRSFEAKIGDGSLPLAVILVVYFFVILLSFWSAPFYPDTVTVDPANHAQFVTGILQGKGASILLRSYYPTGLHFTAALLASLMPITALQALRTLLSVVALAGFIIAYETAQVMSGSKRLAVFVALVAAFAIPVDPSLLISVGLYPNLLADSIILMLLWAILSYLAQQSPKLGVTLAFLALAGVFDHSSVLLFLGAVWVFAPIVYFLFRPRFRAYLESALYSISMLTLFAIILLPIYGGNLARLQIYSEIGRPLTLRAFSSVYLTLWIIFQLYAGTVAVAAIGISIIVFAIRYRGHLGQLLLTAWTALLMLGAFFTSQAWRFALFALVPGYLLVGSLISSSSKLPELTKIPAKKIAHLIPAAVLLFLIAAGPFPTLVARSYSPATRERQTAIADSMQWLSQNGCTDGVVSVGLGSDYPYLPALTGLRYFGDYEESAAAALNQSSGLGFRCVAVSAQDHFLLTYGSTAAFEQKYRNSFVVIFTIKH
ncbi:MAG: hypothetical protein ABSF82_01120 [Candidatus Bathyarchaeia archaeon]|jgi:hypothetical protein